MPAIYLKVSQLMIGIYLLVAAVEWLSLAVKRTIFPFFDTRTLLLKLQDRELALPGNRRDQIARYFGKTNAAIICSLFNACLGLALIITSMVHLPWPPWLIPLLALIFHIIFCTTFGFGLEGADQMALLVLFSLTAYYLLPGSQNILRLFVTAQLLLAYVVSGLAKLLSEVWRSGQAMVMVLSTYSFGVGNARWLNNHKSVAKAISYTVIIFELTWVALPFNAFIAYSLLGAGLLFHLVNSIVMGLNLFPWAFFATYPWVLSYFTNRHL